MKKLLVTTSLSLLCMLGSGCQTALPESQQSGNASTATRLCPDPVNPSQQTSSGVATAARPVPTPTLDTWIGLYLEASKLSEKEIVEFVETPLASERAAEYAALDEAGKHLQQATVLAGSRLSTNWLKAQKLLTGLEASERDRLPVLWLQQILREKQNQAELMGRRQAELEASRTAQQLLENELTEMKQKIEALTQIENALIDKQVEVLAP